MKEIGNIGIGVIVGLLLFYTFGNETGKEVTSLSIIRDTIVQVVTPEPIIIEKVKTKIRYHRDTIIQTKPFIASLDTIVKHDTIKCYYAFPDNLLSLHIAQTEDTIITHQIKLTHTSIASDPWWHEPLYILGGVISGYAIKSMEK